MGMEPQDNGAPAVAPPTPTMMTAMPFPFPLRRSEVALVIIDMQRDFLLPGGFGETLGNKIAHLSVL